MEHSPDIHFVRIDARNVLEVCQLSETLTPVQRRMVSDNSISIAQAHCSENAWMRAIYADDEPVGFLLLHTGSDYEDGIDCPGIFLWRLMIAGGCQGKGYGRKAMNRLLGQLRSLGIAELYTSCEVGEGSPEGFYQKFGFVPTGEYYGEQPELVLKLKVQ
jgi:diamine N-acetyltransferase